MKGGIKSCRRRLVIAFSITGSPLPTVSKLRSIHQGAKLYRWLKLAGLLEGLWTNTRVSPKPINLALKMSG